MKNIKLVASDMDHTLLTEKGELPPNFNEYIQTLTELGVSFAIASGRPLYTLTNIFSELKNKMTFISDNGGTISHKGQIIFKSLVDVEAYKAMVDFVENKTDGISVICGLDSAYVAKKHEVHEPYLRIFYTTITFVDNLIEVAADANKFTIYFPNKDAKKNYDELLNPQFGNEFSVTIGDAMWVDIMNKGIDKGKAMKILGKELAITTEQMMAFGDTYNDAEMLQAVKYSYLVANAHDDMKQYANYMTKSNDEYGVTYILDKLIEEIK